MHNVQYSLLHYQVLYTASQALSVETDDPDNGHKPILSAMFVLAGYGRV